MHDTLSCFARSCVSHCGRLCSCVRQLTRAYAPSPPTYSRNVARGATAAAGQERLRRDFVDACARVKRCEEEAVYLREEARDALVYYQSQIDKFSAAVRQREGSNDATQQSHKLLLELQLSKKQALKAEMLRTQVHLHELFGELAGAPRVGTVGGAGEPDLAPDADKEGEDLGADPEVFPEHEVAYGTDASDGEEDEEDEELRDEGDSGYADSRLGPGRQ